MSVVKIQKRENPYAQIDVRCLNDNRLSWRAKGILAYLLSKPNDWRVSIKDIWNNGSEGRNAVQDCMKELQEFGYAELVLSHAEKGRVAGFEWVVYEQPINRLSVGRLNDTDEPETGEPKTRKSGNRLHTNINSSNKDRESEKRAGAHTPTPVETDDPQVEKQIPVEEEKPVKKTVPAAAAISIADRPNAKTTSELLAAMHSFYDQHKTEWTDGVLNMSKGSRYSRERQVDITQKWACHTIENNKGNLTYGQLNAALQKWFMYQPTADRWNESSTTSGTGTPAEPYSVRLTSTAQPAYNP